MKCDRCKREVEVRLRSTFNTDGLCVLCFAQERKHPDFEAARAIRNSEVHRGNIDYPGIGLPSDFESWRKEHEGEFGVTGPTADSIGCHRL